MKKILILSSIFVFVFSVSMAFAKNDPAQSQKADLYHVSGGSSDNVLTDDPYSGHVTVTTPNGKNSFMFNGVIQGLSPNTEYFVWVRNLTGYNGPYLYQYAPLGYFKLVSFTTDEYGNGNFHYKIDATDLPEGPYNVQVAINDETGTSNQIGVTVAATEKYMEVIAD